MSRNHRRLGSQRARTVGWRATVHPRASSRRKGAGSRSCHGSFSEIRRKRQQETARPPAVGRSSSARARSTPASTALLAEAFKELDAVLQPTEALLHFGEPGRGSRPRSCRDHYQSGRAPWNISPFDRRSQAPTVAGWPRRVATSAGASQAPRMGHRPPEVTLAPQPRRRSPCSQRRPAGPDARLRRGPQGSGGGGPCPLPRRTQRLAAVDVPQSVERDPTITTQSDGRRPHDRGMSRSGCVGFQRASRALSNRSGHLEAAGEASNGPHLR